MKSVMIGIVTYNPNVENMLINIKNLAAFHDCDIYFFIVDNNSSNKAEIVSLEQEVRNLEVFLLDKNEGIAFGLNIIMSKAEKKKCAWVMSLDQDTEFNVNMFRKMYSYAKDCLNDVAAVCPKIEERGCRENHKIADEPIEYVSYCITAGMLVRTKVWREVGKYDSRMFIDLVDFEFCARIVLAGYKICRINEAVLINEIGNNVKEIKINNKNIIIRDHEPIRYYYYTRNLIYCRKKLPEFFTGKVIWKMYVIWFLKVIMLESNKRQKMSEIYRGIKDGISMTT